QQRGRQVRRREVGAEADVRAAVPLEGERQPASPCLDLRTARRLTRGERRALRTERIDDLSRRQRGPWGRGGLLRQEWSKRERGHEEEKNENTHECSGDRDDARPTLSLTRGRIRGRDLSIGKRGREARPRRVGVRRGNAHDIGEDRRRRLPDRRRRRHGTVVTE